MTHSKISSRSNVFATAIHSPFFFFAAASVVALAVIGVLVAHS